MLLPVLHHFKNQVPSQKERKKIWSNLKPPFPKLSVLGKRKKVKLSEYLCSFVNFGNKKIPKIKAEMHFQCSENSKVHQKLSTLLFHTR